MKTARLGPTNLVVSRIGFGAWAIGGPGYYGWGPQDERDSIAAVRTAAERGINWIDTAAIYGLGHSEQIVGRALAGMDERPYVFTKCGFIWDHRRRVTSNLEAASIRHECDASLQRLGLDAIDLYQIHAPSPDADLDDAWSALVDLRVAGKVRWIGVSNFDADQMRQVSRIHPVATLQPPYSMIARGVEAEILPYVQRTGIGVIAYSPLASGLLSGAMSLERLHSLPADDWRRDDPEFEEPKLSATLSLVELLRPIAASNCIPLGQLAIAWVLAHPAVTAAIVGFRRPAQIDELVGAADLELTRSDLAAIEELLDPGPEVA